MTVLKSTLFAISMLFFVACDNKPHSATEMQPPATGSVKDTMSSTSSGSTDVAVIESPVADVPETQTNTRSIDIKDESGTPIRKSEPIQKKDSSNPDTESNAFTVVTDLDASILLDIRYATKNNFTNAKIYDCPACLLRPEAAKAVVKAHKALQKKGFGLKMFDCYRPRPYQQRLWDKVPNPDYVTPPTKGSMHSRGAAVDLTIVDKNGKELDMGTPYDFFGREAHTDNTDLPEKVLSNRKLLREALEAVGFKGIRTEWWHFSYQGKDYSLSDYVWPCK